MAEPILYTRGLSKSYSGVKAVENVDFFLEKGKIHAIVGANGAGKSTFVKLLYGEVRPDSGKIFIDSKEEIIDSPARALHCGIAMVSQDFGLVGTMTVAENLALGDTGRKRPLLWRATRIRLQARKILSRLLPGLDPDTLVSELSVSQQQLVAIARVLDSRSSIFIFDEPTSVLGANSFHHIKKLILQLKDEGRSVIYITHKLEEVFELADAVSVFMNQKIVLTAGTRELSKDSLLGYFNVVPRTPRGIPGEDRRPLLQVDNISIRGLLPVSFSIASGEILGLTAVHFTDAVRLARAVFERYRNHKGLKIGMIPDDRRVEGIFADLSVDDNIGLLLLKGASTAGIVHRDFILQNSTQAVRRLDIKCSSLTQPAGELSGGNQQKILFARWMSWDFDLLILLEPTTGVDLGGKAGIYAIIADLKRQGKSFLLVSSDAEEIRNLCDRVITINPQPG